MRKNILDVAILLSVAMSDGGAEGVEQVRYQQQLALIDTTGLTSLPQK